MPFFNFNVGPEQIVAHGHREDGDGVAVQPRPGHERRRRLLGRGWGELDLQAKVRESHEGAGIHQAEAATAARGRPRATYGTQKATRKEGENFSFLFV